MVDAALDRFFGVERKTDFHQRVRSHDVGRRALHHRHVGVVLPKRRGDVVGRVVRADDDGFLAGVSLRGPGCFEEWCWSPLKLAMPGKLGMLGLADMPVASTRCFGCSATSLPSRSTTTVHSFLASSNSSLLAGRGAPVVELHDLGIHLEPVADLVLGREHRPVRRERQIGHVVVPDRIMQAERLVAVPPAVARTRVLLDDDGRHAVHPQPRAEPDGALAAADDDDVGLFRVAERPRLFFALLFPGQAVLAGPMLGAKRALEAERLLVTLELHGGGEQRPDLAVLEPHEAVAAEDAGFEGEPSGRDAAFVRRRPVPDRRPRPTASRSAVAPPASRGRRPCLRPS